MKCPYLDTKIRVEEIVKLGCTDYVLCMIPSDSKCPKKKQPCQINARCWRLG